MKKNRIYLVAFLVVVLDQVIKYIVKTNLYLFQSFSVIPSFFSITYIENYGAAWGMFDHSGLFLLIISVLALVLLWRYIQEEKAFYWVQITSLGMLLGGIIGNLLDRIFYQKVIDFLDFTIFSYHFPVFNVADIFIVIGVILFLGEMIYHDIVQKRKERKKI